MVLGWTDCSTVVKLLGMVDGESEGVVLGWTDGSRVGKLLGMSDGEIEGVSTDWGVGPVVVGTEVKLEGAVLGFIDDFSVGFWLGTIHGMEETRFSDRRAKQVSESTGCIAWNTEWTGSIYWLLDNTLA